MGPFQLRTFCNSLNCRAAVQNSQDAQPAAHGYGTGGALPANVAVPTEHCRNSERWQIWAGHCAVTEPSVRLRGECAKQLPTHGPSLSTPWAALAEQKMSEWSLLMLQGLHCPRITPARGMCALWWGQDLRKRDLSSTAGHCPALGHSRALETPLQPNPASPTVSSEGCLEPPIKVFLSPAISRGCCVGWGWRTSFLVFLTL